MPFFRFQQPRKYSKGTCGAFLFPFGSRVLCLPQSGGKGGMPYGWMVSP